MTDDDLLTAFQSSLTILTAGLTWHDGALCNIYEGKGSLSHRENDPLANLGLAAVGRGGLIGLKQPDIRFSVSGSHLTVVSISVGYVLVGES